VRDRSEAEADRRTLSRSQAAADREVSASHREDEASDRDRAQAEADLELADRGQTAADHERAAAHRARAAVVREMTEAETDHRAPSRSQAASDRERDASDRHDAASDRQQAEVDAELRTSSRGQAAADRASAASDRDQTVTDRAQLLADADQRTFSRSQAAADRALETLDREEAAAARAAVTLDREQAKAELRHAQIDPLTGAYGRELGSVALEHEINRARHRTSPLVLAYIDVDGLKQVNDLKGHAAGDALLRDVVRSLQTNLRSYDPIVRVGGDEFVCMLADCSPGDARERFLHVHATIEQTQPAATISVGLAELRTEDSLAQLTERADQALAVI
jgi:diguanylate cyclase (GGDEF)-like protein